MWEEKLIAKYVSNMAQCFGTYFSYPVKCLGLHIDSNSGIYFFISSKWHLSLQHEEKVETISFFMCFTMFVTFVNSFIMLKKKIAILCLLLPIALAKNVKRE